jgi:hypothetical protein
MTHFSYDPQTGLVTLSHMIDGQITQVLTRRYLEKGLTEHQFMVKLMEAVKDDGGAEAWPARWPGLN